MDFVHLHVHSHYSLLNGLTKIDPLVQAAKKRGFNALALTDYGSMYGAMEFYKACLKEKMKPIIGLEAYVASRSRYDRDPEKDKKIYHLVLLAENFEGYQNLMRLSSIGHLEGFYDEKPRIDKELLKRYAKGVIALSGPIEGEIPQLLREGKIIEAGKVAEEYNMIFGKDNFYLELQDHPAIEGQMDVIACHQAGMKNVVASSGTALTEHQVNLLKRYSPNMNMAFDTDAAGESAAKRGIGLAIEAGINVKVIQIPEGGGKDPDECLKKNKDVWFEAVEKATDIMNWYFAGAFQNKNIQAPARHRK